MMEKSVGYAFVIGGAAVHAIICQQMDIKVLEGKGLVLFLAALMMQIGGIFIGESSGKE